MNKKLKEIIIESFIHRFIEPFIPILLIIILPLVFFGQAVLGKTIIVAGDFTGSDLLDLNYPFKVALAEAVKNREFPLWTPYLSNGFPLLAEGQMGAFYPPNLIFSFLPPHLALNYSLILTFILAGLFTYLYCQSIGFGRFSALSSAIIFMFSAFFITRIKHLNLIAVSAWVPFIFWTTRKFFQEQKLRFALLTSIGLGLQFLAGHPQMAFYSVFIFFLYFLFEFSFRVKTHGLAQTLPKSLLALIIIALLTIGISAVQVLPTLELSQQTEKTEYTLVTATAYPFHPKNLITFISPYYFGNPALGSYKENIKLMGIFWENSSYIGILAFILALLACFQMLKEKDKDLRFWFLAFLAFLSLVLMLGKYTPVFGFLWTNIPGFSFFRFPSRFNLFLIFSLAIFAGRGAHFVVQKLAKIYQEGQAGEEKEVRTRVKFTWPLNRQKTQALILAFLILDLFVFGKNYVGNIKASWWLKKPQAIEFLEKENQGGLFRILSVSQYADSPYQFLGWKKNLEPLVTIREAIPPDANIVFKIPTLSDRSWFEGGYNFKRRNHLERWLLNEAQDPIKTGKILGLFNVKYILSLSPVGGPEMELVKEIDLGESFLEKLRIFENKQNMERIYYVPEAEVITSETALFTKLGDYSFYPARTVLLEKPPQNPLPILRSTLDEFQKDNQIKIEKYSPLEIIIKTELKNEGFLVISDSFYPGWKATVDGKPQEILPANYLVRALEMTPGNHTIRLFYDPLPFKIGAIITGLTFLSLFSFGIATGLKKLVLRGLKPGLKQKSPLPA